MASHRNTNKGTWFVIAFVIIAAVVLLALRLTPHKDYSYNGFPIEKSVCVGTKVTCWFPLVRIRDIDYTISFYHHPKEVETVGVAPAAVLALYSFQRANGTVIIAVPKSAPAPVTLAATEVSRILGTRYQIFNFDVKAALYGAGENEISCANADKQTLVIAFQQQDQNAVTLDSANCIVLGATTLDDATKVADAFVYKLLGVIPMLETNSSGEQVTLPQTAVPQIVAVKKP